VNLSEINRTLREIRVTPVKTLGQNFLHDQNLARWIVQQAGVGSGDFVVEVGPGLGALTEPALAAGAKILAIEKDARLAGFLRSKFPNSRLEIIHGDALEFDVRRLFPHGRTTFLGNLPYSNGTPILLRFLGKLSPITSAVLMLQMEVAARISAEPGSGAYGILSLIVQQRCRVEFLRAVPPQVFSPEPAIESAVVRLVPRAPGELPEHDEEMFATLVRLGFSQRRKQVGKLLKSHLADWPTAAEKIGASAQARAEEISLGQWIALTNLARPLTAPANGNDPNELFAVVDENDCVIGAAPRSEVHGNNLRHRAVHLFIFNRAGELLLQKRSRWKDRHPSVWDSSAAGHVDAGEGYDETAVRELREELGVAAELTQVAKIPASMQTGEEFICLYRGEHEGPFERARAEIDALEFFPLDLITEWIKKEPGDFAPGFLECWRVFPTDRPASA
jgi:16S rRNA (adenine1518-N6/adenine1519-N6)-dimethyltransferase